MAWDYSTPCALPTFKEFQGSMGGGGFTKTYALGKEHAFLADHVVDGRILMPVGFAARALAQDFHPPSMAPEVRLQKPIRIVDECVPSSCPCRQLVYAGCSQMHASVLPLQATSYLCTAWEALAVREDVPLAKLPVVFEDVSIKQAVQAEAGDNVTLKVLLDHSNRFQVRAP